MTEFHFGVKDSLSEDDLLYKKGMRYQKWNA